MDRVTGVKPLPDIDERIRNIGDPTGMTISYNFQTIPLDKPCRKKYNNSV